MSLEFAIVLIVGTATAAAAIIFVGCLIRLFCDRLRRPVNGVAAAAYRYTPLITKSTSRPPHAEHVSRAVHSGTGSPAPYRATCHVGLGHPPAALATGD